MTTTATAVIPEVSLMRRGRGFKADIKRVSFGGPQAILKDYAGRSWPVRLFGLVQVSREMRALHRLRGVPGVPACYGRWGRYGILLERVEGERITRWCGARTAGILPMLERLDRLIAAIHARGVVHLDLRKRDNVLIDADGRPGIIDFNAACCFEPGGLAARLLLPLLKPIDTSALVKWTRRVAPGSLGPGAARRDRFMTLLRRLWIFN